MAAAVASTGRGRYLEIGAGSGEIAATVCDRYDALVLTELSAPRRHAIAEAFASTGKVTVLAHNIDCEPLPFPDNDFDLIVLVAVIEHVVDPFGVLRELHRLLKPGGRLLIDTPNIAKWTRRLRLALGQFPSTAAQEEGFRTYDGQPADLYDEGHLHYFTFRSLERACRERAGFRRVERRGYGSLRTTKTPDWLARWWPELFSEVCLIAEK
jgi:SAM-dependent methyltransferase